MRRQANQRHRRVHHTGAYEKLYYWPKGHKIVTLQTNQKDHFRAQLPY